MPGGGAFVFSRAVLFTVGADFIESRFDREIGVRVVRIGNVEGANEGIIGVFLAVQSSQIPSQADFAIGGAAGKVVDEATGETVDLHAKLGGRFPEFRREVGAVRAI